MGGPLNPPALTALWLDPADGLIARIERARQRIGADCARTIVLLPYAQLVPIAEAMWARAMRSGFAPRFQTTLNWARELAPLHEPLQDGSIHFDSARDGATARALLDAAGLQSHARVLAPRLVEAAHEVAQAVAATPPADRAGWAEHARAAASIGLSGDALAYEAATCRIALEWAVASTHASDPLWQAIEQPHAFDALVVLEGLNPDPLTDALRLHAGERCESIATPELLQRRVQQTPPGSARVHAALDAEDEAQRAAACVLHHLDAGRKPVALAATDRMLARRVQALLASRGIAIRDETGWALSTSRAAAHAMAGLSAAAWNASCDSVLDWLKNAPAFAPGAVRRLEHALRRAGIGQWRNWQTTCAAPRDGLGIEPEVLALTLQAEQLRAGLRESRALIDWIGAWRVQLVAAGQWSRLVADTAGRQVVQTLHLSEGAHAAYAQVLAGMPAAGRRMSHGDFRSWASEALEGARFVPASNAVEPVVILPIAQLFARPFGALVLPGCDEKRLPAAPEPALAWSASQRAVLGLRTREQLAVSQRAAWGNALAIPQVDLLWRASDAGGEPLSPSPLLQRLLLDGGAEPVSDPRLPRSVLVTPTRASRPSARELLPERISASAYESLRRCPYQFFAVQLLGLSEAEEIDGEVSKRDFGNWLHRVLKIFHETLQQQKAGQQQQQRSRAELIADAAIQATQELALGEDDFLPFAAAWPRVRDGYLAWLEQHEATGTAFEGGEVACERRIGPTLVLHGRIDRIDRAADGRALLIDYKTESASRTRERVADAREDTQLAFYGALLEDDVAFGALYLNAGEKEGSAAYELRDASELRNALVAGLTRDVARIASGAELAPLGEGLACEWCMVRGLCRRDFWS